MEQTIQVRSSLIHRHTITGNLHGHSITCEYIVINSALEDSVFKEQTQMNLVVAHQKTFGEVTFLNKKDPLVKTFTKREMRVTEIDGQATLANIAKVMIGTFKPVALTINDGLGGVVGISQVDVKEIENAKLRTDCADPIKKESKKVIKIERAIKSEKNKEPPSVVKED